MTDPRSQAVEGKRERQQRRRLERQQEQAVKRRQRRRNRMVVVIFGVVPALAVMVLVIAGMVGRSGGGGEPTGVETVAVTGREHVQGPVDYDRSPPAGGPHAPVWQNCGVYQQPVPDETVVHSMEHGAVWIAHRPDLPSEEVQALQSLARDGFVLVAPYDGLTQPVVATAWGRQLRADSGDDERIAEFVRMFRQGPQTPEPGAPCTGGVGEPTA